MTERCCATSVLKVNRTETEVNKVKHYDWILVERWRRFWATSVHTRPAGIFSHSFPKKYMCTPSLRPSSIVPYAKCTSTLKLMAWFLHVLLNISLLKCRTFQLALMQSLNKDKEISKRKKKKKFIITVNIGFCQGCDFSPAFVFLKV